jgi:hypothetical protein
MSLNPRKWDSDPQLCHLDPHGRVLDLDMYYSNPLTGAPNLPVSHSNSSKRGPSIKASMCPWSPLSPQTGVLCCHVAHERMAEAFG